MQGCGTQTWLTRSVFPMLAEWRSGGSNCKSRGDGNTVTGPQPGAWSQEKVLSITMGSEGFPSPQAGNACKRFESENSLSCPNTMVAANLNYLSDPSDKSEELGTKESTVEKRILS